MRIFVDCLPPDLPDDLYPVVVNTSNATIIPAKSSQYFEVQFTMDNCKDGDCCHLFFYAFEFSKFDVALHVDFILFSKYRICTLQMKLLNYSETPISIAANAIVALVTTTKPVLVEDILVGLNELSAVILCDLCSCIYVSYL